MSDIQVEIPGGVVLGVVYVAVGLFAAGDAEDRHRDYPFADGVLWPVLLLAVLLRRLFQIACGKL